MHLPRHFWLVYVTAIVLFILVMYGIAGYLNRPEAPTKIRAIAR